MDPQKLSNYQSSYDRIAEEYTVRIAGELKDKPLDRMLLEGFAARVNGTGRVCDLGCGPGHVARYLHDRGVDIFGVDLSPGMLEQARKLNSNIEFQQGNMLALDVEDGGRRHRPGDSNEPLALAGRPDYRRTSWPDMRGRRAREAGNDPAVAS